MTTTMLLPCGLQLRNHSLPWVIGGSASPPNLSNIDVFWVPPPYNQVKINFDVSWLEGKDGLGNIIRDYYNVVLYATSCHTFTSSISEAKLKTAWKALNSTIYDLRFTRI